MGSKQLQSILKNIPSATANGEKKVSTNTSIDEISNTSITIPVRSENTQQKQIKTIEIEEEYERIVAVVPKSLKQQIKIHLLQNKGFTEKSVILKALSLYGFDVKDEWLIDKRTTR